MANPLARLWTDTCTITRNTKFTDANGITDYTQSVTKDVRCRVSWNVKVPRTDATILQRTDMEARLFFDLSVDILPGDIVELTRDGFTWIFQEISIPMRHTRHQEVNCKAEQKKA